MICRANNSLPLCSITVATFAAAALLTASASAEIIPLELTELITIDGAADDFFGTAVAIDGDYAIIGSRWDDDFANAAGSVYFYHRSANGVWLPQQKLLPNQGGVTVHYADKVAISGDTAIVASYGGSQNGITSGVVSVYQRDEFDFWSLTDVLTPDDAVGNMWFGRDIAIDGDNLIIGATSASNPSGVAYIFNRNALGNWSQTARFQPSGLSDDARFGYSVDIDGSSAIVGATRDDGFGFNSGAAYVFRLNSGPFGDFWFQEAKLISDFFTDDDFGWDVSIDDTNGVALIGATDYWINVNLRSVGSAYFFERDAQNAWTKSNFVIASDPGEQDRFGWSVSLDDGVAIISSPQSFTDSGAVYVFMPDNLGDWTQQAKLVANDAALSDQFGYSVALDGTTAFVGAPRTDDMGSSAGSSYLFDLDPCIGDINLDGIVDTADLGFMLNNFGTNQPLADINADGVVDTADLGLLLGAFGSCP